MEILLKLYWITFNIDFRLWFAKDITGLCLWVVVVVAYEYMLEKIMIWLHVLIFILPLIVLTCLFMTLVILKVSIRNSVGVLGTAYNLFYILKTTRSSFIYNWKCWNKIIAMMSINVCLTKWVQWLESVLIFLKL